MVSAAYQHRLDRAMYDDATDAHRKAVVELEAAQEKVKYTRLEKLYWNLLMDKTPRSSWPEEVNKHAIEVHNDVPQAVAPRKRPAASIGDSIQPVAKRPAAPITRH